MVTGSTGSYGAGWYTTGLEESGMRLAYKPAVSKTAVAFIYPNPASDAIYVEFPQKGRASLVDMQGRVVNTWLLTEGQMRQRLPLSAKTGSGIYLLVPESRGVRQTFKIVVSR